MKFRMLPALIVIAGCTTMAQDERLTNSDVAMVMRVANLGEVREGELARMKATDTSVKDFGTMMVAEHTAQNNKAEAELSRADVVSSDSNLSREIDAGSGSATERLRALSGSAFDRAYIDR